MTLESEIAREKRTSNKPDEWFQLSFDVRSMYGRTVKPVHIQKQNMFARKIW